MPKNEYKNIFTCWVNENQKNGGYYGSMTNDTEQPQVIQPDDKVFFNISPQWTRVVKLGYAVADGDRAKVKELMQEIRSNGEFRQPLMSKSEKVEEPTAQNTSSSIDDDDLPF